MDEKLGELPGPGGEARHERGEVSAQQELSPLFHLLHTLSLLAEHERPGGVLQHRLPHVPRPVEVEQALGDRDERPVVLAGPAVPVGYELPGEPSAQQVPRLVYHRELPSAPVPEVHLPLYPPYDGEQHDGLKLGPGAKLLELEHREVPFERHARVPLEEPPVLPPRAVRPEHPREVLPDAPVVADSAKRVRHVVHAGSAPVFLPRRPYSLLQKRLPQVSQPLRRRRHLGEKGLQELHVPVYVLHLREGVERHPAPLVEHQELPVHQPAELLVGAPHVYGEHPGPLGQVPGHDLRDEKRLSRARLGEHRAVVVRGRGEKVELHHLSPPGHQRQGPRARPPPVGHHGNEGRSRRALHGAGAAKKPLRPGIHAEGEASQQERKEHVPLLAKVEAPGPPYSGRGLASPLGLLRPAGLYEKPERRPHQSLVLERSHQEVEVLRLPSEPGYEPRHQSEALLLHHGGLGPHAGGVPGVGNHESGVQEEVRGHLGDAPSRVPQKLVQLAQGEGFGKRRGGVSPKGLVPDPDLPGQNLRLRPEIHHPPSYLLRSVVEGGGAGEVPRVAAPAFLGVQKLAQDEDQFPGRQLARAKKRGFQNPGRGARDLPGLPEPPFPRRLVRPRPALRRGQLHRREEPEIPGRGSGLLPNAALVQAPPLLGHPAQHASRAAARPRRREKRRHELGGEGVELHRSSRGKYPRIQHSGQYPPRVLPDLEQRLYLPDEAERHVGLHVRSALPRRVGKPVGKRVPAAEVRHRVRRKSRHRRPSAARRRSVSRPRPGGSSAAASRPPIFHVPLSGSAYTYLAEWNMPSESRHGAIHTRTARGAT